MDATTTFTLFGQVIAVNLPAEPLVTDFGGPIPEYALVAVADLARKDERLADVLEERDLSRSANDRLREERAEHLAELKAVRLAGSGRAVLKLQADLNNAKTDLAQVQANISERSDKYRALQESFRLEAENLTAVQAINARLQEENLALRMGLAKIRAIAGTKSSGAARDKVCRVPRCDHSAAGRCVNPLPF